MLATPLILKRTVHVNVAGPTAEADSSIVSTNVASSPLGTVLLVGFIEIVNSGSHDAVSKVTSAGRFCRPLRIALAMFAFYLFIWGVGGPLYASLPLDTDFNPATDDGDGKVYWILGIVTLLSYIPFYLYRRYVEDPRHPEPVPDLTEVEMAEVIRDK